MASPLLRTLLVVAALFGLLGQTTVRAMPMQALATHGEVTAGQPCEELAAAKSSSDDANGPEHRDGADCTEKMGCALVVAEAVRSSVLATPASYQRVIYRATEEPHRGVTVSPEVHPPSPSA